MFLSKGGSGAIIINYMYFDFIVSLITYIVVSYKDKIGKILRHPIKEISNHEWLINREDILNLFLVGYTYSSLSLLLMDLIYLLPYRFKIYIGGMGMVDAIFLSGLFIFFTLMLCTSFFI